jgi:hypothetical protein
MTETGTASAAGAGDGLANLNGASPPAPFRVRPWHWQYVLLMARFLVDGSPIPTQRELAAKLKVHEVNVSKWRHRAGVEEWIPRELRRLSSLALLDELVVRRVAGLAIRGSVQHARLYAEIRGWGPGSGGPGLEGNLSNGGTTNVNVDARRYNVNFLVPERGYDPRVLEGGQG